MKIENKAAIVEDAEGNRQLQIDITTHVRDPKRMSVMMSMALEQVTGIENMIAKAEASHIESLYQEYQKPEEPEQDSPVILAPDMTPASAIVTV